MYSQADEEIHILRAVGTQEGAFLDIGAWNPKEFSNSRALFEAGWSGVLIEPSPEPFLSLLKEYGNEPAITLICAAVGFERGLVKLHATADAVSTTSEDEHEKWKDAAKFAGSFLTPVITLDEIFTRFGGDFGFVNIDAEGMSADLFLDMLRIGPRPKCVCVEHDGRMVQLVEAATREGYKVTYSNQCNVVLVL